MSHRAQLLDEALLYLFSFDVETNMDRQELGFVPGGVRITLFARPNLSLVYHLYRARTIPGLGFEAINGTLTWGGDWIYWREDDIEFSDVRATINTHDNAKIHMSYPIVADLGPGGFRRIVSEKEKIGKEKAPVNWPVVTAPLFETADVRYRWLMDYQCVGFGFVQVIRSEIRRLTYDIYAMT